MGAGRVFDPFALEFCLVFSFSIFFNVYVVRVRLMFGYGLQKKIEGENTLVLV